MFHENRLGNYTRQINVCVLFAYFVTCWWILSFLLIPFIRRTNYVFLHIRLRFINCQQQFSTSHLWEHLFGLKLQYSDALLYGIADSSFENCIVFSSTTATIRLEHPAEMSTNFTIFNGLRNQALSSFSCKKWFSTWNTGVYQNHFTISCKLKYMNRFPKCLWYILAL